MSITVIILLIVSFLAAATALRYFIFVGSDAIENGFLSAFSSFLILSLFSWVLMRFDEYSINWIICGGFALALLPVALSLTKKNGLQPGIQISTELVSTSRLALFALMLIGLGALYAFWPTYYMLGGRDPGLYLLFSKHIAQTGGLHFTMPAFSEFSADSIRQSYPGLYSAAARHLSSDNTVLIPQFMHLFPSVGAIFYSAAGLEGLVRANAFIAVLALWGVFVAGKRLMGYWPALATVLVLGINPAVIWNARITLTESLSMAIFFGGLAFLWRAYVEKSTPRALTAGAVLGIGLLVRVDASLTVLVIVGVAAYAAICDRKYRKIGLAATLGYVFFSTIGYLDGYLNSFPYIYDLWRMGALKALVGINYAAAGAALLLLAVPEKFYRRIRLNSDTFLVTAILGAIVLGVWLVISYFIWPRSSDSFQAHASRELGWYVSPPAYPLFLVGIYLTMRERRIKYFLPLWLMAGATVLIFTWRPSITPDLIWATRRWVPYVIPLMMLFSVACVWRIAVTIKAYVPKAGLLTAGGCALALLYYGAHSYIISEPFLFKSMLHKLPQQYASLAKSIKNTKWPKGAAKTLKKYGVVFTRDAQIASMLTYLHDIPTVVLAKQVPMTQDDQRISSAPLVGGVNLVAGDSLLKSMQVCARYLEITRGHPPQKTFSRCYDGSIGVLPGAPWHGSRTFSVISRHVSFSTIVGKIDRSKHVIRTKGTAGFLLYGPYITLPPGKYMVIWRGTGSCFAKNRICGHVDVASHAAKKSFAQKPFASNAEEHRSHILKRLEFRLESKTQGIEFRISVNSKANVAVKTVTLERLK